MNLKSLRVLFRQFWPYVPGKRAVQSGYLALKGHPHVLADIALRNYVFADAPSAATLYDAGRIAGRREAALEIIRLARLDPASLWDVIEARTNSEKLHDRGPRT